MPEEKVKETPEVKVDEKRVALEEKAKAKGWKPEKEYTGDGEWVDAKEFLGRESFFEKIKHQSEMLKKQNEKLTEMDSTIKNMTDHFKKVQDVAVAEAISKLKAEKKEAIQAGDTDKVEEIEKRIEDQKQIKVEAPTKDEIKPEVKEWVLKNPWFNVKENMQKFAISFEQAYLANNPGVSLSEALDETKKAVESRFPEEFKDNSSRRETPVVESPSGADTGKKKGYGRDRLISDAQRQVYDQVVKKNLMPPEEYVKQLELIGELS